MDNSSMSSRYTIINDLRDQSPPSRSEYARLMLQHTKQQLDVAANSALRRSSGSPSSFSSSSSNSSVSSTGS
ncbi:hypothetical protein EJ06DRAFT_580335 [Trichodelitschia bisporula]|uniref:Uncharacterized protein n=1 Tax=Trichodelitschia bisporula TaxID=703511 RepID=A0A6G1I535_9PEZI|nr:hypothetical protein EJ06DRAFT_580335 [Trichodelitschia bisporula]